jgi:hypothetical protein
MSSAARRLQRRGYPVAGEQLDAAEARYRSAQGHVLSVRVDSDAVDMLWLYRQLKDGVAAPVVPERAFAFLDGVAEDSVFRREEGIYAARAVEVVLNLHWLQHHGLVASGGDNGMLFFFSRPHPKRRGERVGFVRANLDATRAEEGAFWRNVVQGTVDGTMVKVTMEEGDSFEEATLRGLEEWLARPSR